MSVFAISLLGACKKSEDAAPTNRAGMLVGTWSTTEVGVDSNNNGTWDASEHRPAAGSSENVTLTFNNNGTGTATYAVFGSAFPITWNLQNSDNDLRLISNVLGTSDTTIANILSFTSSEATVKDESTKPVSYMILKKQ